MNSHAELSVSCLQINARIRHKKPKERHKKKYVQKTCEVRTPRTECICRVFPESYTHSVALLGVFVLGGDVFASAAHARELPQQRRAL